MDKVVLIRDCPQILFQRRVCDLEYSTSELAEAFGLGAGVSPLQIGAQQPDLGNAFGNVIVAAFLNLGATLATDDLDAQDRDWRPRLFQVGLRTHHPQLPPLPS